MNIQLRRADGTATPYIFQVDRDIHPENVHCCVRSTSGEICLGDGVFSLASIPASPQDPDVEAGSLRLGHDDVFDRLIVEFGDEEPRLGLIPNGEARSMIEIFRWQANTDSRVWAA